MADSTYLPPIIPKTPEVVDQYLVEYYRKVGEFCDECYQEGLARQKSAPELKAMDRPSLIMSLNPVERQTPQLQARADIE